jgi:hypothetical protein
MKVEIRDANAVRAIRPGDAALYLRSRQWVATEGKPGRPTIWLRTIGGEEYEILLPMSHDVPDYALRMGDLLAALAAAEHRSQWEIYRDLLTITADVVRIRIADPELVDGTLPIEEHAQIAQKARDIMLAAACAATEHRPVWHSRKPAQATEHVRRIRIGQSERGSYVVTVVNQVTPLLEAPKDQLFEMEEPFDRRVTQTLAESLQALDRAAEQATLTRKMEAFDRAVPLGVNANLCDGVAGLWGDEDLQRQLEFSFSWSPARPISGEAVSRVTFSSDRIPVIREAGRQMREREPLTDFELRGPVVKLVRAEGATAGKVTVIGLVEDHQARVTLEMDPESYHLAVNAHDQGKTLRVFGKLVKEGRGFHLKDARDLAIDEE